MKLNKDIFSDFRNGDEVNILSSKHMTVDFDKGSIGLSFDISFIYHLVYIKILNLVFRFY